MAKLKRSERLLKAALSYARLGWYVFPVHSPKGAGCSCQKGDSFNLRTRQGRLSKLTFSKPKSPVASSRFDLCYRRDILRYHFVNYASRNGDVKDVVHRYFPCNVKAHTLGLPWAKRHTLEFVSGCHY